MSFAEKKGITVASGFKLQAGALLDARGQVETIAERDELVTLHAATAGLQVYVKANKTLYVYNGAGWDELSKGNLSGNLEGYVPKTRKVNNKPLGADITLAAGDVGAIAASAKGAAGGVAELDSTGKVPAAQLPSYVDDVLEYSGKAAFPATGETGKIYVDSATNLTYRWSGTTYVEISQSLALGETASTAFRGDQGKIAYTHSQAAHAPANAEQNVQSVWNETDTASDAFIKNKPASLPANGGNAQTVNRHSVNADVPENAKFTDTVYTHPDNHPATMITQDAAHRFASDTEKAAWNAKANVYFASELPASAPAGAVCFLVS